MYNTTDDSINKFIDILNEALKSDQDAISNLFKHRVLCNKALALHPSIQVHEERGAYSVGLLGILNGILGADENGWGPIAASFEVVCPKGCNVDGCMEGDTCPTCFRSCRLGNVTEFVNSDTYKNDYVGEK